jgi:hypothetical protein
MNESTRSAIVAGALLVSIVTGALLIFLSTGCHDLDRSRVLAQPSPDGALQPEQVMDGAAGPADLADQESAVVAQADLDAQVPADARADADPDAGPADMDQDVNVVADSVALSSYGTSCSYNPGNPNPCPDGKTVCVPSPTSGAGICTYPCGPPYTPCQPAATGAQAICLYTMGWQTHCVFVCKYQNKMYPCPTGLSCLPESFHTSTCWP